LNTKIQEADALKRKQTAELKARRGTCPWHPRQTGSTWSASSTTAIRRIEDGQTWAKWITAYWPVLASH
jgi:hypothetical protein